ncbi:hypothetical protein EVJ58_g8894 [Rhodofomes roseus]|uniref:Uncharacterized protein n=1 Tax=Rhodofomes roseus TaxID=34475 RepID=A0A4Y9XZ09_9APHY|nr:hypothetical protein EVJ58_g8894 [Rhodofomes roseus]
MELLDGPAPLLEFLSISEEPRFDSGSAVIGPLSELLRRPESSGLRHLELNCPVDWTGVSLPRLTLLSVGNCRDKTGMEAFLNALAQMPLLEELITQYAFIDYRGEPAASPLVPRAVLSRLRVLRLRETAANCTCILESLDTPSLSRLCVNSVERGSALWQAHLCAAAASKMDVLGQIGTLAVSGNRANFPYDIFLRCYHDVPNTPATDAEEDSTHDWLNDCTPFLELNTNHCIDQEDLAAAAFCQLLSIQSLRCLVFHKKLPSQTLWRHLIKHTQFVAELRVFDIEDARDLPAMLVRRRCGDLQGYEDLQYALPRLLCLTLDEVSFRGPVENNPFLTLVRRRYGMGTKHPPFISTLLDCLIERYENGAEIETLRLLEPHDIKENRDVEDLKHVVRYVEWSNSWTPLTWEHDGFDGELPSSCIFSTAIIPW